MPRAAEEVVWGTLKDLEWMRTRLGGNRKDREEFPSHENINDLTFEDRDKSDMLQMSSTKYDIFLDESDSDFEKEKIKKDDPEIAEAEKTFSSSPSPALLPEGLLEGILRQIIGFLSVCHLTSIFLFSQIITLNLIVDAVFYPIQIFA